MQHDDELKSVLSTPGTVLVSLPDRTLRASWWACNVKDGEANVYVTEMDRLGEIKRIVTVYRYGLVGIEKDGCSAILATAGLSEDGEGVPDTNLGMFNTIEEAVYAVRLPLLMDQLMED